MVSGMELTVSRALDSRALFAVGLSLCAGLAVLQMPQLAEQSTRGPALLLDSGFVVAGVLVVALNLLFRLGVAQRAQRPLHASSAQWHADITNFVETQGAAWGARRAVVQRAALAALEAAGSDCSARHPRRAPIGGHSGHFDEFHLDIELLHTGAPLLLRSGPATPASAALLEGDDDQRPGRCPGAAFQPAVAAPGRPCEHPQRGPGQRLPAPALRALTMPGPALPAPTADWPHWTAPPGPVRARQRPLRPWGPALDWLEQWPRLAGLATAHAQRAAPPCADEALANIVLHARRSDGSSRPVLAICGGTPGALALRAWKTMASLLTPRCKPRHRWPPHWRLPPSAAGLRLMRHYLQPLRCRRSATPCEGRNCLLRGRRCLPCRLRLNQQQSTKNSFS